MRQAYTKMIAGAACMAVLAGCASSTPYLDSKFGQAVNAAKAQQTINPEASRNTDPVAGVSGAVAKESMGRYLDSFKAPPPTFTVVTPGVGTAGER